MARRNRHGCSPFQTGAWPGEFNLSREQRSDFHLLVFVICTFINGVLRRPVDSVRYRPRDSQKVLRRHGFKVSMSGTGNCQYNAAVETYYKTVKADLLWRWIRETP
jgi:hypothetical protein